MVNQTDTNIVISLIRLVIAIISAGIAFDLVSKRLANEKVSDWKNWLNIQFDNIFQPKTLLIGWMLWWRFILAYGIPIFFLPMAILWLSSGNKLNVHDYEFAYFFTSLFGLLVIMSVYGWAYSAVRNKIGRAI